MLNRFLIIFLLSFTVFSCKAQYPAKYSSTNKKAIKHYEEAQRFYDVRNNQKAKEELEDAIDKDPNFIEAYTLLAYVYADLNNTEEAIKQLNKTFEINPDFFPNNYYSVGGLELATGKYADAKSHLEKFLTYKNTKPEIRENAERYLKNAGFAIEAMKKPVPFNPINMGRNINTQYHEYFPAITADGNTFLYTRNMPYEDEAGKFYQEDFYVSIKNSNEWQPASNLGKGINTANNEGAPSLSADGQILFFIGCEGQFGYGRNRQGLGSCDVFYTQNLGAKWSAPENLGPPVNTGKWESQPSFSSDGKTLYFIRGNGRDVTSNDIYKTILQDDGTWSNPVKLSDKINTPFREESIFIHPDDQTLYFSSEGHTGMGGLDIYMSRRQADGEWGEPVNLGYPINTHTDENSILIGPSGDIAYFASDRKGGFGGLDLYHFELYKEAQPQKITYMKGKVYNSKTKQPLEASFELIDLETSKTIITSQSNEGTGQFLVTLPANKNYALNVSKQGYLFYSENFAMKEGADLSKPFMMDVPLQPIDTGGVVELKNVFFEMDKYDLKPESKAELNKLVSFLNTNPKIKIELSGHTDNTGEKKYNQILSNNRAKSVYDYLVASGISKERLTYKGYGDTKLKVPNDNAENRAKNRRTEFKVTAK